MILQSLHALYDRLVGEEEYQLAAPGFSPQKIAFRVVLHPDGTLFGFEDARNTTGKGKKVSSMLDVPFEGERSGTKIKPYLLFDNQTYVLGRQPLGQPKEFAETRFRAFCKKHYELELKVNQSEFSAVCRFLENWNSRQLLDFPLLEELGMGFGVFRILGQTKDVHALPVIRNWWMDSRPRNQSSFESQCLLSGEITPIARLHPVIKGVIGANPMGARLVSFNELAYESYRKVDGYISPVGDVAASRYGTALNALLAGPQSNKHRFHIADTTCVFWTGKKTILEDIFGVISGSSNQVLEEAQDHELRTKIQKFLEALRRGKVAYGDLADDPDHTRFYILGLAPNSARLSVRFFYESSIRDMLDHLRRHQADFKIVREFEQPVGKRQADSEFPYYWEFLRETVRQGDDHIPLLGGAFIRAIVAGTSYPEMLLVSVIRRVQTERTINYLRAATIKAVLTRNHQLTIPFMLDPASTCPAYLHGRLFAVLEKIQEEGHFAQTGSQLKKGIREAYFSAACATPSSVFPRLERLSTYHSSHLMPNRQTYFNRLIGDIKWSQTPNVGMNKIHSLEDQGLFILGYYHQRKDLFTHKEKASEPDIPS